MSNALTRFSPAAIGRRISSEIKARAMGALTLVIPSWMDGQPQYNAANLENAVHSGYKKNEIIYACLQAKAMTATSVQFKVYDRQSREELPDHPLRLLIENPNPLMSEADYWGLTWIYRDLAGVAYWPKLRNKSGETVQLWPMRPDYVRPVPHNGQPIGAYQYGAPGMEPVTLPGEDVLAFRIWDPLNFYGALSPVQVAGRVVDIDNAATDFIKLFRERGTQIPGILSSKLKLNDGAITDIRRRWRERYGGYTSWMEPAVLDSDASYQKIGLDFKEMDFEKLDARNEARICMILQTPPIIIGATVGLARSTFSNYETARKTWWEDYDVPQYKNMASSTFKGLGREWGDGIYGAFDLSTVPALQEERNGRWARATAGLTGGGITINDFRKEVGLELLPPQVGDVLLRSSLVAAVPANETDVEGAQVDESGTDGESKALGRPKAGSPGPKGKPLAPGKATEVATFVPGEIDGLFDLYGKLKKGKVDA